MKTLTATDLRKRFYETLKRVAYDKEPVTITRQGRPVVSLVPAETLPNAKPLSAKKHEVDKRRIARFCERHHMREFSLFGSILTDDFNTESDVDVLYDPEPGTAYDLHELTQIQDELESMFGRRVDAVSKRAVVSRKDSYLSIEILNTAKVIYGPQ